MQVDRHTQKIRGHFFFKLKGGAVSVALKALTVSCLTFLLVFRLKETSLDSVYIH